MPLINVMLYSYQKLRIMLSMTGFKKRFSQPIIDAEMPCLWGLDIYWTQTNETIIKRKEVLGTSFLLKTL